MVLLLTLSFQDDAIFYAGEKFVCLLTLSNTPSPGHKPKEHKHAIPLLPLQQLSIQHPPSKSSSQQPEGTVPFIRSVLGATFSYFTGTAAQSIPEEQALHPSHPTQIPMEMARRRPLVFCQSRDAQTSEQHRRKSKPFLADIGASGKLTVDTHSAMTENSKISEVLIHSPLQDTTMSPFKIQLEEKRLNSVSQESSNDLPTPISNSQTSVPPPVPITKKETRLPVNRTRAISNAQSEAPSSLDQSELASTGRSESQIQKEPGTEEVAWAFVQMAGHFAIDDSYVKMELFESLQNKIGYRVEGGSRGGAVIGGGSLGVLNGNVSVPGSPAETKNKTGTLAFSLF